MTTLAHGIVLAMARVNVVFPTPGAPLTRTDTPASIEQCKNARSEESTMFMPCKSGRLGSPYRCTRITPEGRGSTSIAACSRAPRSVTPFIRTFRIGLAEENSRLL